MADTAQPHNQDCKRKYHDEHLCYLMYMGVHFEDKAAYRQLIQNARYRCQKCGRTAHAARNLCEPVEL